MFNFWNSIRTLLRVTPEVQSQAKTISTACSPLLFRISSAIYGEPLKKRRKIDPGVTRTKELKKRKKMEQQIKKLLKRSNQFKPLEENEVPIELTDNIGVIKRDPLNLSEEEVDRRFAINKEWNRYKRSQHMSDIENIRISMASKTRALEELKAESGELYNMALQVDEYLLPFKAIGPMRTPPINSYNPVDGDFIDTTRDWEKL